MAKLTQRAILAGFEEMLREMPFHKITVSALVERCCISPNTFYYHYRDIYALLDAWMAQWHVRCQQRLEGIGWKAGCLEVLKEIQAQPEIILHICDSIPRQRLREYVFGTLESATVNLVSLYTDGAITPQQQKMLAGVVCFSMTGFLLKFIQGGMRGDVEGYFGPILDFLEDSILHFLQGNPKSPES